MFFKLIHRVTKVVFFFSLSFFNYSHAQQYGFLNYTTDNGLAQSQVTGMCQDNNGYLWFSTYGGLSRFDGFEYKNYSINSGLLNNQVHSIFKDSKGRIWLGGMGGYSVMNHGVINATTFKNELSQSIIISICETKNGNIYLLFDNTALMEISNSKSTSFIIPDSTVTESRNIIVNNLNEILISTNNGIYTFNQFSKTFSRVQFFGFNNFSFITQYKSKYAVSTFGDGVYLYENKNLQNHYSTSSGLIDDAIRQLYYDNQGNLWVATISGVSLIETNNLVTNFNTGNGLINNNVRFTAQDNEGNIWFGTDGKGILKFSGRKVLNYTRADGLPGDLVMSIIREPSGTYWFATYGDGVAQFKNGKFNIFNNANGLPNNIVWTLAITRDGLLWIGTSNGLCTYDGKKFKTYSEKDGLLSNKITSLFVDESGLLWIGNKNGLNVWNGKSFQAFGKNVGISGGNIRCIVKDKIGNLWLAGSAGLIKFNRKKAVLYRFNKSNDDNTVYSLRFDYLDNLWVGTREGLYLFENETFIKTDTETGTLSGNVNFLMNDDNLMWIGTNSGIYEMNMKLFYENDTLIMRSFDKNEGLKGRETNMNAIYKDNENNLWFGTDGGLVKVGNDRFAINSTFKPYVHITDVKIFFENPKWNKISNNKINDFGFANNAKVKYNQNHFTFYFTGISHTQPQKLRYRFMLKGYDQNWLPVTETRYVTYSSLPPGDYTFLVTAQNANGLWSSHPSSFSFTIIAPFWRTWWFYSLCATVVVLIIIALWQFRLRQLKRKNENMQLFYKSKLLALEQQSLNASMNRHFIFNSLNSIQYYINKQDKLEANRYLTNFAKLIRKNLDSSISSDHISLVEELDRIKLYLSLELMRFKDRFTYSIEVDKSISPQSVMIPPMLFQPYIENSIWHGILPKDEVGKIQVKIYPHPNNSDLVIIEINDDGIGLTNSLKNKVYTGSTHVSRGIEITSGRLNLLKEMTSQNLEIIGPHDIADSSGKTTGTSVKLIISVKTPSKTENNQAKLYEN